MKIVLRASTHVVKNHLEDDQEDVNSPDIFRMIASKNNELEALYDDDSAFSQYCHDGSDLADAILKRIKPGGWVRLVYDETLQNLFVETAYESTDDLSDDEIQFLVRETLGQWSDGAGGSAMDDFSGYIEPYYVELDEINPENVTVTIK